MDEVYISTRAGIIAADCYKRLGAFAITYDRKHGYYGLTHLATGLSVFQSLDYDAPIFDLRLCYLQDVSEFDLQGLTEAVREEIKQALMLRPGRNEVGV